METKKPGRPPKGVEVYCTASLIQTSKGPMHHGDRLTLPPEEAQKLKSQGFVQ